MKSSTAAIAALVTLVIAAIGFFGFTSTGQKMLAGMTNKTSSTISQANTISNNPFGYLGQYNPFNPDVLGSFFNSLTGFFSKVSAQISVNSSQSTPPPTSSTPPPTVSTPPTSSYTPPSSSFTPQSSISTPVSSTPINVTNALKQLGLYNITRAQQIQRETLMGGNSPLQGSAIQPSSYVGSTAYNTPSGTIYLPNFSNIPEPSTVSTPPPATSIQQASEKYHINIPSYR